MYSSKFSDKRTAIDKTHEVEGERITKMKTLFCQIFYRGFEILCICATLFVYYLCIDKFLKNEDVSIVDFRWFHNEYSTHHKDIYPTISICFYGIPTVFLDEKLKQIDPKFDAVMYSNFLNGNEWNEEMLKIDFDEVTLDIVDYLEQIRLMGTDEQDDELYAWKKTPLLMSTRYTILYHHAWKG